MLVAALPVICRSSQDFGSKTGAPQHLLWVADALDLDCRGHCVDLIEIVRGERDRERPQIFIRRSSVRVPNNGTIQGF
jgi:hypothetical protein